MSKKILMIEGAVIVALLGLNWLTGPARISSGKAMLQEVSVPGQAAPEPNNSDNTVDLERPPFLVN